jgi:hypothetical protein
MRLKTIIFLLIGFFFLIDLQTKANVDETHKFYVSHLNMNFDEQSKTFQLSFSIFIDDLEMTLEKQFGNKTNLDEVTDSSESLVFDYVNTHFLMKIEGKTLGLKGIGYEIEDDIIWVYIETIQTEIPESIEITNNIMFELYAEQKNMVKIKVGERDYSALFTVKNPVEIVKLSD